MRNGSTATRTNGITHTFRGWSLTLAALAMLMLALVTPAGADTSYDDPASDLGGCLNLQVPAGNEMATHVYAAGVQIYRWTGTSWEFVAPVAVLFTDSGADGVIGIHYAGPTWQGINGSKVVGTVVQRCTADNNAIPWLLLGAVSSEGPGVFDGVTFIQRVNTAGGNAPPAAGSAEGEVARVPYTAEYLFYKKTP